MLTPALALLAWLDAKPARSVTILRSGTSTLVSLYRSPAVEPEAEMMWSYRADRATATDALAQVLTAALADDDYIAHTKGKTG